MKCTPDVPSQTLQTGGLDVIRVEARAVCAGKPGAAISRNIQNIHGTFGSDMVRVGGEGRRRGGGAGPPVVAWGSAGHRGGRVNGFSLWV